MRSGFMCAAIVGLSMVLSLGNVKGNSEPFGSLDVADATGGQGWAYDPDLGMDPVNVHIYVDNQFLTSVVANQSRPDLVGVVAPNAEHGFSFSMGNLSVGDHTVVAYAIDEGGQYHPPLWGTPKTVTVTADNALPIGSLDGATESDVFGWAYDADAGMEPVDVHLYVNGTLTDIKTADESRPDLVGVVAANAEHGYHFSLTGLASGSHQIQVFAIDANGQDYSELTGSPYTLTINSTPSGSVHVDSFGAVANDGQDDLAAIEQAIQSARQQGIVDVLFGPGVYDLSDKIEYFHDDSQSLTLAGNQTTLRMHNPLDGVIYNLYNRGHLTVKNFTVDYAYLPYCQGTISEVSGNSFTFTVDPVQLAGDDSFHPDFDDPIFQGDEFGFGVYKDPAVKGRPAVGTDDFTFVDAWQKLGPRRYRLTVSNATGVENGMQFVYVVRPQPSTFQSALNRDGKVSYENITVYSSPGLVFVATMTDEMEVRNCQIIIKPNTGRIHSSNGDGVHSVNCKNGPQVTGCVFQGIVDDAVNIYAKAMEIYESNVWGNNRRFRATAVSHFLNVGDVLTFYDATSGFVSDGFRVSKIHTITATNVDFEVSSYPGAFTPGMEIYNNNQSGANFVIADNVFFDSRGHGVLAKASNGQILNNHMSYLSMGGVRLANEPVWNDGLICDNILIQSNTVDHCGYFAHFNNAVHSAAILVAGFRDGFSYSPYPLQRNIAIMDNHIVQWPRHAIKIGGAKNVHVTGNVMQNTYEPEWPRAATGDKTVVGVDTASTADIFVYQNTIEDNQP